MEIIYDPEVDILRILFSSARIEESDEDKPGLILDYDDKGNVVGMEVLVLQSGWKTRARSSTSTLLNSSARP